MLAKLKLLIYWLGKLKNIENISKNIFVKKCNILKLVSNFYLLLPCNYKRIQSVN